MIKLEESSPIAMLKQFANYLEATIHEDFAAGKLVLDNSKGKGYISLYELFPGLTAWIYNISLNEELKIKMDFSSDRPYYFGYNVSGYQMQRFSNESEYQKLEQNHAFVLIGDPGSVAEFTIPAMEDYQCCYLILNPVILKNSQLAARKSLQNNMIEVFHNTQKERPYRHIGKLDMTAGKYAKILVNNDRTDVVGRLLTEGAISNLLAAQIEEHDASNNTSDLLPQLTDEELTRISEIGDYIQDNINSDTSINALSSHFYMSPKKLQAGVRFLFGCSINDFVNGIRMETARELMHYGEMSVSEICYLVGISSRSYFSKMFYKRFGALPRDYNKASNKKNLHYELCYRSFEAEGLADKDIENIVRSARSNNKKYDITGCLIHHRGVFFQLIEGPEDAILKLYDNIKNDRRNFDVRTIWKGSKAQRNLRRLGHGLPYR